MKRVVIMVIATTLLAACSSTSTSTPATTMDASTLAAYHVCIQREANFISGIKGMKSNCLDLPLTFDQREQAIKDATKEVDGNS